MRGNWTSVGSMYLGREMPLLILLLSKPHSSKTISDDKTTPTFSGIMAEKELPRSPPRIVCANSLAQDVAELPHTLLSKLNLTLKFLDWIRFGVREWEDSKRLTAAAREFDWIPSPLNPYQDIPEDICRLD
jgi:hypothetical protein